MLKYLKDVNVPVEIYYHDPQTVDGFFVELKGKILKYPIKEMNKKSKVPKSILKLLIKKIRDEEIKNTNDIINAKGIGLKTLIKIYSLNSIF